VRLLDVFGPRACAAEFVSTVGVGRPRLLVVPGVLLIVRVLDGAFRVWLLHADLSYGIHLIHAHLVAFIAHQYYRLHDNLVDVLLTSVQTFENAALREHRAWCFDERKRHEHATESLPDDLDASVFQVLRQIREAVSDDLLSDQEKVAGTGLLVRPEQTAEAKSRELRASLG
jgi:hypothetical protein